MSNDTTSTAPVEIDETVPEKSDHWTIKIKKPSLPRPHVPGPKTIAIATASAVGGALIAAGTGLLREEKESLEIETTQDGLSDDELAAIAAGSEAIADIETTSSDE